MSVIDKWIPTSQRHPKEGDKVQWISPEGYVVTGTKGPDRLWFVDGIYVYYEPMFWKPEVRDE